MGSESAARMGERVVAIIAARQIMERMLEGGQVGSVGEDGGQTCHASISASSEG